MEEIMIAAAEFTHYREPKPYWEARVWHPDREELIRFKADPPDKMSVFSLCERAFGSAAKVLAAKRDVFSEEILAVVRLAEKGSRA